MVEELKISTMELGDLKVLVEKLKYATVIWTF